MQPVNPSQHLCNKAPCGRLTNILQNLKMTPMLTSSAWFYADVVWGDDCSPFAIFVVKEKEKTK